MDCTQCGEELLIGADYPYLQDAQEWFCDEICLADWLREQAPYVFRSLDADDIPQKDEGA